MHCTHLRANFSGKQHHEYVVVAIATSMFAISTIFAYYYLSLDKYVPVIISGVFGMLQMALVVFFHEGLEQVVHMQIIAMFMLIQNGKLYLNISSSINISVVVSVTYEFITRCISL